MWTGRAFLQGLVIRQRRQDIDKGKSTLTIMLIIMLAYRIVSYHPLLLLKKCQTFLLLLLLQLYTNTFVSQSSKQNNVSSSSIPHKPASIGCFKFKCANMMFDQIAHLREHIKTHERPFECGWCGEKFAKGSLLQHHVYSTL